MNQLQKMIDDAGVTDFAVAMKSKLLVTNINGKGGWQGMTEDELRKGFVQHVLKGDVVDVANYCMFLWAHGWQQQDRRKLAKLIAEALDVLP